MPESWRDLISEDDEEPYEALEDGLAGVGRIVGQRICLVPPGCSGNDEDEE